MEISRRRLLAALALTPWLSALPLRAALPEQQRIIALEWLPTELLLALGVAPLAVADTRNYNIWVGEPPLPPQTVDVGLRTEPNLELMTQLHPSLILCSNGYGPPPEKLKRIAPIMGFDLNRGDGKPLSA
ncbi:MAG TPA: Fe(3+)-hydroxamate ABC transporter substrate-binding protein FhuD, partial [Pantoea sp.]|nr:Fe(3+)-hydroxamate ABC transporter substrate-binding protein FhuD [Pantoea sp.]